MTWAGRAAGGDGGEALHALVLYDSEQSLCARAVPYLRGGLDRGEAVTAVVSAGVQQILRTALGDDATRVRWQADDLSYRRLGAMFEGFRRFLADQRAAGVGMRLLAQNDTIGAPERMAAYVRFEAMANEVYRPYGYRWACLYDTRDYSAQTLRQVRQVHPQLLQPGGRARSNGQYLEPSRYVTQAEPLPRPPAAVQLDFEVTDPGELPWGRRAASRLGRDPRDGP